MRESWREETKFSRWEMRRFSIRRRDNDQTEGLPIEMALSRVSAARFRGLIKSNAKEATGISLGSGDRAASSGKLLYVLYIVYVVYGCCVHVYVLYV